jgi:hypothetical protein
MERKKRQRYRNEFRRNAVERMNAWWDNIIALAQGGLASAADCSTFGVIDPPRPRGIVPRGVHRDVYCEASLSG